MDGILVLNKPAGFTSFDCIAIVRGVSKDRKLGHTGTLDPNATGVLPICFGKATKLIEYMDVSSKTYVAGVKLGLTTDTQDIWGTEKSRTPYDSSHESFSEENIKKVLNTFVGEIMQTPPAFSAVHIDGVKAYKLAKEGREVKLQPRKAVVYSAELLSYNRDSGIMNISVCCGRGTYIRTIIHDMGQILGCGAVMTSLERVSACGFELSEAISLEDIRKMDSEGVQRLLKPLDRALGDMPRLNITDEEAKKYMNGMTIKHDSSSYPQELPIAVLHNEILVGISRFDGDSLKPVKVFV